MQIRRVILFVLVSLCFSVSAFALDGASQQPKGSNQDFDAAFGDEFENDNTGTTADILISDPFEGFNRGVFWVNDKLYVYVLKPVAKGYRVFPRPVRTSVGNFFSNLSSPISIVNSLLQLKFGDTSRGLSRLVVNTTLGLGGLFDPADKYLHIPKKKEDFGQTLGYYGVGQGPYLVLPLFGPSSLRDATGSVADMFCDPMTYAAKNMTKAQYFGLKGFEVVNYLSLDDDSYEKIKRDSLDPYLFMRAAYAQYRLAKVKE